MQTTDSKYVSSISPKEASLSMSEHGAEEEDGWVIVKKQRITILVPPLPHPLIASPKKNSSRTTSKSQKKRRAELAKCNTKRSSQTPTAANGNVISSGVQESNHNIVVPLTKLKEPQLAQACNEGRRIPVHRKTRALASCPRLLPIGALNVVNRRLRALNLERKLKGLGGLPRWLVSQGLHHFVKILEREKVEYYQLANLSMSKLKDMGTDAVGPRRKLIHRIDSLCQPYYAKQGVYRSGETFERQVLGVYRSAYLEDWQLIGDD